MNSQSRACSQSRDFSETNFLSHSHSLYNIICPISKGPLPHRHGNEPS